MLREKPEQFKTGNPLSAMSHSVAEVQIHALGEISRLLAHLS